MKFFGCAGGVKGVNGALADYMLVDAAIIAKKTNLTQHGRSRCFTISMLNPPGKRYLKKSPS